METAAHYRRSSFLLFLVLINTCLFWEEVADPLKKFTAGSSSDGIYIIRGQSDPSFHVIRPEERLYDYIVRRWPQTAPSLSESCRQIRIEEGFALYLKQDRSSGKVHCDLAPMCEKYRYLIGLPLNINRADRDEFCLLPGIGDGLAEKIIMARERKGRFSSIDELSEISGIGRKLLAKLHNRLTL